MKHKINSKRKDLFLIISLAVLATFTVSGAGLDSFMLLEDSATVHSPTINMSFNSSGLEWMSDEGVEVNLTEKSSFNYSFKNEVSWYDLNSSVDLKLENSSKISNVTKYTFEAYDSSNNTLTSCSSFVNNSGLTYCDNTVSTADKIKGFKINFTVESVDEIMLKQESRTILEAE